MFKLLIFLLYVYAVSAITPFIKEGNRAKFFELTDNEISVFRVSMSDEEYKLLIQTAQVVNPLLNLDFGQNGENAKEAFEGADISFGGEFKTKNATMIVEINGEKKSFKKVTFSIGGNSARTYGRQAFNVKIRGNDELYGRSQFRIRSDAREPTLLRSKLACDMHNRLGLTSISANYISLYINDNYMGIYVIMDSPKISWAKLEYNDGDTTNLYKCKEALCSLTVESSATGCVNENDEITENPEWIEFLTTLDNAQSAEDIEDIFDIDQFLYEIAYEYLSGSWDHFLFNGHNFNVYKKKGGKWTIIYYDFDADLGQDASFVAIFPHSIVSTDFPSYPFSEWSTLHQHLIEILIFKDPTRFENILKNFVREAFNPTILFPRIDELKELIKPYIIEEKTPDENGNLPGVINKYGMDYSIEQWDANSEFTTVTDNAMSKGYGIKYWILMRYRYVCKAYDIECDPVYMDENYQYTTNKNVEASFDVAPSGPWGDMGNGNPQQQPIPPTEPSAEPTSEPTQEAEQTPTTNQSPYQCWSEVVGYSCCSSNETTVYAHDDNGDWGYDFNKQEWCGLTPYDEPTQDEACWSEELGYSCCKSCKVYETDNDGQWGYENNQW